MERSGSFRQACAVAHLVIGKVAHTVLFYNTCAVAHGFSDLLIADFVFYNTCASAHNAALVLTLYHTLLQFVRLGAQESDCRSANRQQEECTTFAVDWQKKHPNAKKETTPNEAQRQIRLRVSQRKV